MRQFFLLAFFSLGFAVCHSAAETAQSPAAHLYAVVFEVTVDGSGKVETLALARVIDPLSGKTTAVDVPVPDAYVTAARVFLSQRTYASTPSHFFTYTFFDPAQPTKADIDPKAKRS